ncbi:MULTISPECIES: hypothetical protein [Halomonas]|uniref:hypothetical protein n=1 Tax=Halomonas TaxID=2745 RepID=UPI001C9984C8|nr:MULTISPECIES: hypothetical protein [Halomonas]MBY5968471.1 hypothetical protein [Halomonas denitrificans]MBY5984152.1 hypothetical protein [Halomonas sp. DP5Y7-2]
MGHLKVNEGQGMEAGQGGGVAVACQWRLMLAAAAVAALTGVGTGQSQAAELRPGVQPGEIIVLREVETAPFGYVNRDSGPIRARADLMRSSNMARSATGSVHSRMGGVTAIVLDDTRAASISAGVGQGMNQMHRALGTGTHLGSGGVGSSNRVATSVGGGSTGGSVIGATSGIANTVTGALAPLTGGRR